MTSQTSLNNPYGNIDLDDSVSQYARTAVNSNRIEQKISNLDILLNAFNT